ncbi:MAG: amino acid ABC transporter substrate-binding protein [Pseudomonadota bacterium]|nr:amino acid ABC transporter substrate-binding protein [Pseudomonadota bacterium]
MFRSMFGHSCAVIAGLALATQITISSANADRLASVKKAGVLHCGIVPGLPGYGAPNKSGKIIGFDIDLCHAIAAAILGDPNKVKLTKQNLPTAFGAMKAGTVDVVTHRFTWTFGRDVGQGLNYTKVMVWDGQGFMVRKSLGVKSLKELSGATICLSAGSTTQGNVADYFKANGMKYKEVTFASMGESQKGYDAGRCDVFSSDKFGLGARTRSMKNPSEHMILPEQISNEPIGPMVAHGDDNWRDLVFWVLNALVAAEELGITKANVDQIRSSSKNAFAQRLLGVKGKFASKIGLSKDWAYNAIKAVGNYGEIWENHLGSNGLGMPRGRNELVKNGGLMISMPFR